RIEKVARMQKLPVVTRELALPLIDETVGSERLDASPRQPEDHGTALLEVESARAQPAPPPVSRPELPQREHQDSPVNPHLNWTSPDGHLNEVAAGRVAVVPPAVHGSQE